MKRIKIATLALAVGLTFSISQHCLLGGDKDKKDATDADKLQGAWRVVSGESAGMKFGPADLGDMKVTFSGKTVRWEQKGSEPVESSYTLAPTKSPRQIDFGGKAPVGKKAPPGMRGAGIYKFEGEKLHLHVGVPGKAGRPKDFTSRMGSISTVYVLERVAGSKD